MRKGAGLAILAIASLYQINKVRKQKAEKEYLRRSAKAKKVNAITPPVKRRTPLQIIQEAEKKVENETQETIAYTDKDSKQELTQKFAEENESTTVYIVGKGKKYHLTKDCRGIKKDSELTEMTLNEANEKGYTLCGWEKENE